MNELLVWVVFKQVLHVGEGLSILAKACELHEGLAEGLMVGFLILSKFLHDGLEGSFGGELLLEDDISATRQKLLIVVVIKLWEI